MTFKKSPFLRLVMALFVFSLIAAACGSDDDEVAETTVPADTGGDDDPVETTVPADDDDPVETTVPADDDPAEAMVPDNEDNGVHSDEILVGWLGDLTGPTASTQTAHRDGAAAYFEYVNQQGGVLGRDLTMLDHDDAYVADETVIGFRRLVDDDKILAFIGLNNSSAIEALSAEVASIGVPVVGSMSGSTTTQENDYFWNTVATYADIVGVVEGRLAEQFGGSDKLVVIPAALTVASGDQWIASVEEIVGARGGKVLDAVHYDARAEDLSAEAVTIQNLVEDEGANAMIIHGTTKPFIVLFDAMNSAGVTDLEIGGMTGLVQPEVFKQAPTEITDQAWGIHTFTPMEIDTPGNVEMRDFIAAEGKWDESSQSIGFVQGWVNGKVFVEGVRRAGETGELSRASLQDAMGTIDAFDTGDQSPLIDFTRPGHNGGANVRPYDWTGTELAAVGEYADWLEFLPTH